MIVGTLATDVCAAVSVPCTSGTEERELCECAPVHQSRPPCTTRNRLSDQYTNFTLFDIPLLHLSLH